jgi:RND family efflux transporter MFP subunit
MQFSFSWPTFGLVLFFFQLFPNVTLAQQQQVSYANAQLTLIDDVEVATLDPGVVLAVGIKPGDTVSEGQLLVQLDAALFEAEAKAAELNWIIAKAEHKNDVNIRLAKKSTEVNDKTLQKSQQAVEEFKESISEAELDRLKLERDQSVLSMEQAILEREIAGITSDLREEEKNAASIRLDRRSIRSPLAGIAVAVNVQRGESVTSGQPVVRIIDYSKLRIKAVFEAQHVLRVAAGQPAVFKLSLPKGALSTDVPENLEAIVTFVSPEIRASEKVFEVWAEIDNSAKRLRPGMKGTLTIKLNDKAEDLN